MAADVVSAVADVTVEPARAGFLRRERLVLALALAAGGGSTCCGKYGAGDDAVWLMVDSGQEWVGGRHGEDGAVLVRCVVLRCDGYGAEVTRVSVGLLQVMSTEEDSGRAGGQQMRTLWHMICMPMRQ